MFVLSQLILKFGVMMQSNCLIIGQCVYAGKMKEERAVSKVQAQRTHEKAPRAKSGEIARSITLSERSD